MVMTDYLNNFSGKNNYNTESARENTHCTSDLSTQAIINHGPVTSVTIPYFSGNFECIADILQRYNIRVSHKLITTVQQLLT